MKKLLLFLVAFFAIMVSAKAESLTCTDPNVLKAMGLIGYILFIIKVLVPVVIIIKGMSTFAKVVLEDGDTKKAAFNLFSKFLVGAIIFMIPTVIAAVFDIVESAKIIDTKYSECTKCLTTPDDCY